MRRDDLQARFLESERGRLFALMRRPAQAGGRAVLFVPAFAEEMNKSRHLFTEVSGRLAQQGMVSVMVDLFGTGDSAGEFADADWQGWKSDLATAARWCESEGNAITAMLAVRLGCALGCEMVRERSLQLQRTVLWQPVLSGARALDQFLRLRVAATMMQKDGKETVAGLRARLKNDETVETAGYEVTRRLAEQLDQVNLQQAMGPQAGSVHWMEIVRSADAPPATPTVGFVEQARANGMTIDLQVIQGEPFWSSVEIVRNPVLVEQTVRALAIQP